MRPKWDGGEQEEGSTKGQRQPGITPRDVRLATLICKLHQEEYITGSKATTPFDIYQPTWKDLLSLFKGFAISKPNPPQRRKTCKACSGPHPISQCGLRRNIKPPTPCPHCSGTHWLVDCPGRKSRTVYKCSHCGGPHTWQVCPKRKPRTPCRNCGGDHWMADCREPQIPPDVADKMRLPVSS